MILVHISPRPICRPAVFLQTWYSFDFTVGMVKRGLHDRSPAVNSNDAALFSH
jgi:hypothetical protein